MGRSLLRCFAPRLVVRAVKPWRRRAEGLYSSHLITWRQQRETGLTPKTRGRKPTAVDPQVRKLEQENRRLTSRLQKAEALLAFQKKVSELLQIPLRPFVSDEDD